MSLELLTEDKLSTPVFEMCCSESFDCLGALADKISSPTAKLRSAKYAAS
jgi:hypothetical protein